MSFDLLLTSLFTSLYFPFTDLSLPNARPWYTPIGAEDVWETAPWEGIGTGWALSLEGGGTALRPAPNMQSRVPVATDNTETLKAESPVSSVFNGNFEAGTRQQLLFNKNRGRFPFSYELPGWSFHGGAGFNVGTSEENLDVTAVFVVDTGTILKTTLLEAWNALGDKVLEIAKQKLIGGDPEADPTPLQKLAQDVFEAMDSKLKVDQFNLGKELPLGIQTTKEFVANNIQELWPVQTDHALLLGGEQILEGILAVANPLTGGLTADLIESLADFNTITHNWMYIPDDAESVHFNITAPALVLPSSRVNIYIDAPDVQSVSDPSVVSAGALGWRIGSVDLQPSFFTTKTYGHRIPTEFRGRIARLTLELEDLQASIPGLEALGDLSQIVFLDDVQFGRAVTLEDSSADPDDGVVFFFEFDPTVPPASGPEPIPEDRTDEGIGNQNGDPNIPPPVSIPDPVAVLGRDRQTLVLRNTKPEPVSVRLTVRRNDFLVFRPQGAQPVPYNEFEPGRMERDLGEFEIPGAQAGNAGILPLNFEARLPMGYMNALTTEEVLILGATIGVATAPVGATTPDEFKPAGEYKLFYLVDAADDDWNDKTLKFANTLFANTPEERTRILSVQRPAGVSLHVQTTDSAGGTFQPVPGGISFTADDTNSIQEATGSLDLLFNGEPLNPGNAIKLQARATPPHKVTISLKDLETSVRLISLASPPPLFPDERREDYDLFKSILGDIGDAPTYAQNIGAFLEGFKEAFQSVHDVPSDELVVTFETSQSGGDATFRFGTLDDERSGGSAPGALLGFYYTSFENLLLSDAVIPVGLSDPSNPESTGIFEARPLREFLSPAAKRFRLDQVINPLQFSGFEVFTDNKAKRAVRLPAAEQTPAGLGRFFGATAAHEFGHNLGFLEEYRNDSQETTLFGNTFMSRASYGSTTVIDEHELSMALAFNNPARNVPLNALLLDDLIYNFWKETDTNDADLHQNRGVRSLQGTAGITPLVGSEEGAGGEALTPDRLALATQLPILSMWENVLGADLSLAINIAAEALPPGELAEARITQLGADGLATEARIVLDTDGLGMGWFIDPTPLDTDEFTASTSTTFQATEESEAAGRYDLLTALVHEIGHLAGFSAGSKGLGRHVLFGPDGSQVFAGTDFVADLSADSSHLESSVYPGDLMTSTLSPSTRRLPSTLDAQIIATVREGAPVLQSHDSGPPKLRSPAGERGVADTIVATLSPPREPRLAPMPVVVADLLVAGMLSGETAASSNIGLTNGSFSISDRDDPGFAWTVNGSGAIVNGAAVLNEDNRVFTRFSQRFLVPSGATVLRFTIRSAGLATNELNPADAFETALLDANTNQPLVGTASGLTDTDALLNMQATGEVFFEPKVTVPGVTTSGQTASLTFPLTVTVDLSGVAAGTEATLYFDLLGFGATDSSVTIDDVVLVGAAPPLLSAVLDPASDSGVRGDGVTNLPAINLIGTTDPLQDVLLDRDGDGFNDGSVTADTTGRFTFAGVPLNDGSNELRLQATNPNGTSEALLTLTLDTQSPTGSLIRPQPDTLINQDQGFVEIQWNDPGGAGLDPSTLDTRDITITGVTVDQAEDMGAGRVRYRYNVDGDILPAGTIDVLQVAGEVTDRAGNPNAQRVSSFELGGTNHAPLAGDDSYQVGEDTTLTVTPQTGLLANDNDSDDDPLSTIRVSGPANGALNLSADGSFVYTPNANFNGTDSFTYTASDGTLDSNTATVTITVSPVNDPPDAVDDSASGAEDGGPIAVNVLANDGIAPDTGETLVVSAVTQGVHGTVTVSGGGSGVSYTPEADFNGTDSFTYTISDGNGGTDTATVTVTVNSVNDPPVAAGDSYRIDEDTLLSVMAPGVLGNDSDLDGDRLSVLLVSGPFHGTLTPNADGSFNYLPNANFNGTDSFIYKANDGSVESDGVAVTIDVAAMPDPDINVLAFTSGGAGALGQLEITYEIASGNAPPFEFAFYGSADAHYSAADTEHGPGLFVADAVNRTAATHTIRFDGAAYASFLVDLAIPFLLVRADANTTVGDDNAVNDYVNFIGIFHRPASARPLVMRGRDDTDRVADNPDDIITIRGARRRGLSITSGWTAKPLVVAAADLSEIRFLGLGGNDQIRAASSVRVPLKLDTGSGNDTAEGGSGGDTIVGGLGDDMIRGWRGDDVLWGGDGDEWLWGNRGRDIIFGDDGQDYILGRRGADILCGGTGDDNLRGWRGRDSLSGGAGADSQHGGPGPDTIWTDGVDQLLESGEIIADVEDTMCSTLWKR